MLNKTNKISVNNNKIEYANNFNNYDRNATSDDTNDAAWNSYFSRKDIWHPDV